MAGSSRNDTAIEEALAAMVHALTQANKQVAHGHQQQGGADELRLDRFMCNHPPTFKGMYDPEGVQTWLQGIERIFRAMVTTEDQKVRQATHMLVEEAEYWWANASRGLGAGVVVVSWDMFKGEFLKKYFPTDVRNKKEVEFLELISKGACRLQTM